jgi:pimeloyl-ACP methyl ester carboxylesterase
MPSIVTDQGVVHYEVYGQGKPVILLHGWLGSWGLWQETMESLGKNYRTYALDFWGFGESGKKRESYTVDDFVSLVYQFMQNLGIAKAPLVGHSMGGTVSLATAIKYPEKVSKVVVIGSPIVGSSLAFPLKLAANKNIAALIFNQMNLFQRGLRIAAPFMCKDPQFPQLITNDVNKTTLQSFLFSISSLKQVDLQKDLRSLSIPVMGMYGGRDNIVSPLQWKLIKDAVPNASIVRWPDAQHFLMLDAREEFQAHLKNFLDLS